MNTFSLDELIFIIDLFKLLVPILRYKNMIGVNAFLMNVILDNSIQVA